MRIVLWRYKVLSYVALGLLMFLISLVFTQTLHLPGVGAWLVFVLRTTVFVVGIRIFRVTSEDIEAPRPWWRAAGTVESGYTMAVLQVLVIAVVVGQAWALSDGTGLVPYGGWTLIVVEVVVELVLAAWFVVSSIRLAVVEARTGVVATDEPSSWRLW